MNAKIKKLRDDAIIPIRATMGAAGYDLFACFDANSVDIAPHETVKIGTGFAIQPPKNTFGAIFARSGLATKQGLRPSNCVGVCDEDFTGEYIVALYNDSNETRIIHSGQRIAQLVFIPYVSVEFEEVTELDETDRGICGFGSTGM